MQILRKLKTANSLLMLIIYRPASEQRFYLVLVYIALVYTLKITYKKGIKCPSNEEYLKINNKMSLPQRSLPQRTHNDL